MTYIGNPNGGGGCRFCGGGHDSSRRVGWGDREVRERKITDQSTRPNNRAQGENDGRTSERKKRSKQADWPRCHNRRANGEKGREKRWRWLSLPLNGLGEANTSKQASVTSGVALVPIRLACLGAGSTAALFVLGSFGFPPQLFSISTSRAAIEQSPTMKTNFKVSMSGWFI